MGSREYVQRLRALVQEEMAMQEERMDHFFSKSFEQENAGPLFPLAWTSNMEISRDSKSRPQLHERQDFAQAHMLEDALESLVPEVERVGVEFQVYVTLETAQKNFLVVEELEDGTLR